MMSGLGECSDGHGRRPPGQLRFLFAPIRQGMRGAFVAGRAPAVVYQAVQSCWWLWWPCDVCGGVELALRDRARLEGANCTPAPPGYEPGRQPCPGCETHCKRLEPGGAEPTVWYDTLLGDWVLRLPCHGLRDGALLPLEIPWFDAPRAEVYRAAGDIAYASDAFEGSASDEPPGVEQDRERDSSS
jgi:hypothetical protein